MEIHINKKTNESNIKYPIPNSLSFASADFICLSITLLLKLIQHNILHIMFMSKAWFDCQCYFWLSLKTDEIVSLVFVFLKRATYALN